MTTAPFTPTHEIETPDGTRTQVRAVAGDDGFSLYTRAEWDADANSDWELTDGELTCLGQAVNGSSIRQIGSGDELVTLEWMPLHLRASHEAARNCGVWPHNGAWRDLVTRSRAEQIVADEGDERWARIID